MKLQVTGCSHHRADVALRERLAFSPEQTREALRQLKQVFPQTEAVVLSTCNRTEIYLAGEAGDRTPTHHDIVEFLADFHRLPSETIFDALFEHTGEDAVRHLFTVAASLDSMVVGEAQILSQVKQAFALAQQGETVGPLLHMAFAGANRVAKRVQTETAIHRRRVSIPSVAVSEFASRLFERFTDKCVLVIGAGEMGEETAKYLKDAGVQEILVVNRNAARAQELAARLGGQTAPWEQLDQALARADLVVSTTGATEPIMTVERFRAVQRARSQRMLFILDLAVPRDFAPSIGDLNNVYLYCIDDLSAVCEANRKSREKEWPKAERIIEEELARLMADWRHRETVPAIRRLRESARSVRDAELQRLFNRLPNLEPAEQREIERAVDRVVNKLLHPPLETLRNEAAQGAPHGLLDALKRLFQIGD